MHEAATNNDVLCRRRRSSQKILNLHRITASDSPIHNRFADAEVLVPDRLNQLCIHSIGGTQQKLFALLVELVDRAGFGARELDRPRW